MNMTEETIKLFVGCAPNGEDAESQMVLEHTARKHSSMPIDIVWMKHSGDPENFWFNWNSQTWATPFSGFRWGIPEACNFEGQAIYMDSDMIVLGDLAELWNNPWDADAVIQSKGGWRFCVSKWNCERAKNILPSVEEIKKHPYAHQELMAAFQQRPQLAQTFDRQWNNFDGENDDLEDIKILHYTDMSTQMHMGMAKERLEKEGRTHWYDGDVRLHRRPEVRELFKKYYDEAIAEQKLPTDYYENDPGTWVRYAKQSQVGYESNNGFDVTKNQ